MELHVAFEPDESGWVRATVEELPGVITCAPTLEEARELVRDALAANGYQRSPPSSGPPLASKRHVRR